MKLISLAVLCIAFLVPARITQAAPAHVPSWASCTIHLDWLTRSHVTARDCVRYPMPKHVGRYVTGHTKTCRQQSPHVRVCVRFPQFRAVSATETAATPAVRGSYTAPMLVTYYLATGSPMANGIMPSVGWAACGNEIPLGARVDVPGVGTLTCGDRIGYDPYHHIDVFGVPLATGVRDVTVYLV